MSCWRSRCWGTAATWTSFMVPNHPALQGIIARHLFLLATVTVVSRPLKYQTWSDMRKWAFIMLPVMSGCHSPSFRAWCLVWPQLRDKKVPIQILVNFDPKGVFFLFTVNNLLCLQWLLGFSYPFKVDVEGNMLTCFLRSLEFPCRRYTFFSVPLSNRYYSIQPL